ncbi:MAG: 50S ribosomal protein L3 [Patescibacteria group bacterium]
MKAVFAKKIAMSELFDQDGNVIPVTVLESPEMTVLQVKTKEKDGYGAVQFGIYEKKEKNISRPLKGHFVAARAKSAFVGELPHEGEVRVGDKVGVSVFQEGEMVDISGKTKGRGFQGVVKRHGFGGGPRTHGQKHSEREPGSIGSVWPQRVLKGKRMAGRMGQNRVTVRNMAIVKIEPERCLMFVKGAVPGARGAILEVRQSRKK